MSTVPVTATPSDGNGGGGETSNGVGALVSVGPVGECSEPIGGIGAVVGVFVSIEPTGESPEPVGITGAAVGAFVSVGPIGMLVSVELIAVA